MAIPSPKTLEEEIGVARRCWSWFKESINMVGGVKFIPCEHCIQLFHKSQKPETFFVALNYYVVNLQRFGKAKILLNCQIEGMGLQGQESLFISACEMKTTRLVYSVNRESFEALKSKMGQFVGLKVEICATVENRFGAYKTGSSPHLLGAPTVNEIMQ